jgi:hypothetical protein
MTDRPVDERTFNARIRFGDVVSTPAALRLMLINGIDPYRLLNRHATGDWSEMDAEDQAANRQAATSGARVFSSYRVNATERVWIITEAADDNGVRSHTTFLLPCEH